MMKKRSAFFFYGCSIGLVMLLLGSAISGAVLNSEDEHFSVREYHLFHDVLHPLQHDALPKKDFKTIRARACELSVRGEDIVKLGVPSGVKDAAEFEKELKRFADALAKFKNEAAGAPDTQFEESYVAVHDTFEMLASMLPKRQKVKDKSRNSE